MSKNLFEERNDLENISLEDLLEQEEQQNSNSNSKKEKLKEAGTQALDITKKVAVNVKDKADEVYQEKKATYKYNKANGIDNFDDKLKKSMYGYDLSATFYKWQMNRNLLSVLKEEEQEKGQTLSYFIKGFLFNALGFKGLVFYYVGLVIALLIAIETMRTGVIMLIPIYLIFKYISVHVKYTKNAKFFDFQWYFDLIKQADEFKGNTAKNTYLEIPSILYNTDNELENYLESRGKKGMASGQREYASISNSKVIFDERYGYVRVFEINNLFFRKAIDKDGLKSVELNDYYLIPQNNNNNSYTDDVYFQVHGEVHQAIAPLMGLMHRDEFIDLVVADESINYAFPEIQEKLAEEAEREALLFKQQKEQEEEQKMYQAFEEKGLNDKAIKIVMKLKKNQEDWGISIRDLFGRSLKFSPDYLKVRADLVGNTTRPDVVRNANKIAQKVGLMPKIQQAENESAVYLLFRLKDRIKSKKLGWNQIVADANEGIVNIGAGTLGDVKVYYPRLDEPFFSLIGGISRSGKSTFATRFISGALMLNDGNGHYDYEDVFIGSMKAVDDYIPLGWDKKGMVLLDDPQKIYNMLQEIDEIAQQRVQTFQDAGVVNIKQYNKKYPDKKMGKILLIMDEYKNTMTSAESFKVETEGGKKKLSEAIEDLLVKINSLHGSRGVNTIVITQSFAKNGVGRVRDTLGSQFLGYADKDVWNSIDTSQEMSKYMSNKEESRQGLFFMKAPDFRLVDGTEVDKFDSGFIEISTHYTETEVIRDNFKRQFNTADKYLSSIIQDNSDLEPTISEVKDEEILDLFD
ncbi:hypothetical protein FG877_02155 [Enterococcus casseliflavus]|nr:hypothetical protein [Enterococcus casseliflavus]